MKCMWQSFISTAAALLLASAATSTGWADELSEDEFRRLHQQLRPSAEAPWRTIPWKIALLDTQRAAAQEKKLIFIWAMDGHPLGCT